jgi:hypothetical protein
MVEGLNPKAKRWWTVPPGSPTDGGALRTVAVSPVTGLLTKAGALALSTAKQRRPLQTLERVYLFGIVTR